MTLISIPSILFTIGLVLVFLPRAPCHVPGGGFNTDFTVTNGQTKSLLSVLSHISVVDLLSWERAQEARRDSWDRHRPQHKRRRHHKRKQTATMRRGGENDIFQDDVNAFMYEHKSGRTFQFDDLFSPLNEVWRRKRDVTCSIQRKLYQQVRDLNAQYDVAGIFSFSAAENVRMPSAESVNCGNDAGTSDAECIVEVIKRDLGSDHFPRYVRDVQCTKSTSGRCQAVQIEVTVFRKVSCENGQALFRAVRMPIGAGCHCNK